MVKSSNTIYIPKNRPHQDMGSMHREEPKPKSPFGAANRKKTLGAVSEQ